VDRLNSVLDDVLSKVRGVLVKDPAVIAAYEADQVAGQAAYDRALRKGRVMRLRKAGVPLMDSAFKVLEDRGVGGFADWEITSVARRFGLGPRRILVLTGDLGRGKTTAAACVAFPRMERGRPGVVYVRERVLAKWLGSYRHDREWDAAIRCATLIVDELGTAVSPQDQERARMALLEIVDDRMNNDRKTVLIGNLARADFDARFDRRMIDRLRDIGVFHEDLGASRRRDGGDE